MPLGSADGFMFAETEEWMDGKIKIDKRTGGRMDAVM